MPEIGRVALTSSLRPAGWALAGVVALMAVSAGPASARHYRHHGASHPAKPGVTAPAPAAAIFSDEHDCIAKKALDAPFCHNAFVNARAEYEEKAPRFESKVPCARFFGAANCAMRISTSLNGVTFLPSFGGFMLSKSKNGADTTVLPVLAGKTTPVDFQPRPVATLDTDQDAARGKRAQVAWRSKHDTGTPRGPGGAGALSYRAAPPDAAPSDGGVAPLPGPMETFPVKPGMMQRMEDEMRKYGTPPRKH